MVHGHRVPERCYNLPICEVSRAVTGTEKRTQAAEERVRTHAQVSWTACASATRIEAVRWRSEATETKRSAGGKSFAMRWRFATFHSTTLRHTAQGPRYFFAVVVWSPSCSSIPLNPGLPSLAYYYDIVHKRHQNRYDGPALPVLAALLRRVEEVVWSYS